MPGKPSNLGNARFPFGNGDVRIVELICLLFVDPPLIMKGA